MDFVTDDIAIGDGVEAEDEEMVLGLGITHVLNVHPMRMNYKKVCYARIPWHDAEVVGTTLRGEQGKGNFEMLDEALDFMDRALKNGGKVLVICGAGFERSPLTVFAYLHKKRGLCIGDALSIVRTKRPQSDLHLNWLGGWLSFTPEESLEYRRYF